MRDFRNKLLLQISPTACVLWALMLLVLPIQWLTACLFAAAFHEFSHAVAVRIFGGRIVALELGSSGARMQAEGMPAWKTILCTLAGPAGGLLLTLTSCWFPRLALCGLVHSVYNLLPVLPLDGGKVLHCVLEKIFPERIAMNISKTVGQVCCGAVLLAGLIVSRLWKVGLIPMLPGILLLSTASKRKRPCKPGF